MIEYLVLHVGMFLHVPLLLRQENTPRHLLAADVRLHLYHKRRRSLPRVTRSTSPLGASNPLARTRSAANRPTIPKTSKQSHLESLNSLPKSLRAERKETPNKKRGFLKSLLKRNRSWMDESLYSYLDEY
ncbi:hypothetical protein MUK42_16719 [Musa troglodytarum]|uniref:Uncharacterized protein n=1 Tax=Musa troglodytarum TaxID=320322 RepID=A0A9E7KTL1_9LILI|nr:hypothetical protein MUK42_16719 [Musa troglodytarum]